MSGQKILEGLDDILAGRVTGDDEFERTSRLRLFGVRGQIQQQWRKPKIDRNGYLAGWDYEWRPVPHVYGEDND